MASSTTTVIKGFNDADEDDDGVQVTATRCPARPGSQPRPGRRARQMMCQPVNPKYSRPDRSKRCHRLRPFQRASSGPGQAADGRWLAVHLMTADSAFQPNRRIRCCDFADLTVYFADLTVYFQT